MPLQYLTLTPVQKQQILFGTKLMVIKTKLCQSIMRGTI